MGQRFVSSERWSFERIVVVEAWRSAWRQIQRESDTPSARDMRSRPKYINTLCKIIFVLMGFCGLSLMAKRLLFGHLSSQSERWPFDQSRWPSEPLAHVNWLPLGLSIKFGLSAPTAFCSRCSLALGVLDSDTAIMDEMLRQVELTRLLVTQSERMDWSKL